MNAIERHRELTARIRAQQAKTAQRIRAAQEERHQARANAPVPERDAPVTTQPKVKKQERKNPGSEPVREVAASWRRDAWAKTPDPTPYEETEMAGDYYYGTGEPGPPPEVGMVWDGIRWVWGQVKGKGGSKSTASDGDGGRAKVRRGAAGIRYGRRRRRRRLLTSSDKADIAFVVGQLGTGQIGRAAISALLSRRV